MDELSAAQREGAAAQEAATEQQQGQQGEVEALRVRVEGMAAEQRRTVEGHVQELTRAFVVVWVCCGVSVRVCVHVWLGVGVGACVWIEQRCMFFRS